MKHSADIADMSDAERNHAFRRRWTEEPVTPRELQHAADLELAHGNAIRAEMLAWQAHHLRIEVAR